MTDQNIISETYHSYIIESIGAFIDSCDNNAFNALRSLQRIRQDWQETPENKDCRISLLSNINAVETLLTDIAEGQSQRNQMILNQYEQNLN